MNNIEDLISEPSEEKCGAENYEECKSARDSKYLCVFFELMEIINLSPRVDVYHGMKYDTEHGGIACHLVENIESFVRVGC